MLLSEQFLQCGGTLSCWVRLLLAGGVMGGFPSRTSQYNEIMDVVHFTCQWLFKLWLIGAFIPY